MPITRTRKRDRNQRWRRVYALRRAFTQQIVWAGMKGDQPVVSLTDHLDDVIHAALTREARLAERRLWRQG